MSAGKLTNIQCQNAKFNTDGKGNKLSDGNGLFLHLKKAGKYWHFYYRFLEKQKTISFGVYPEVSLKEARQRRDEARQLVRNNLDPAAVKKMQKMELKTDHENNFESITREWHEQNKHTWKEKHADNILSRFETKIFPVIGNRPIKEIEPVEVLRAITKIKDAGNLDLAKRTLQMCSKVFRYAMATGRAKMDAADPVKDSLPAANTEGRAFLEERDLPTFLKELENYERDYNGKTLTKLAFRLMVLTFVRSVELRGAKWEEINWDKKEWRIPKERMKMEEEHIVPLSKQSIKLLGLIKEITGNNAFGYIFPSQTQPNKIMSDNTLMKVIHVMGYKGKVTVHGFRKTASTILHESQFDSKWIEIQLSHADRNQMRATYNFAKHLPERHKMMQWYADYIDELVDAK